MDSIQAILVQGLLFSLVAMGVYITYKILDFPDLSVDGTYPLGAAVCATLLVAKVNPILACVVAALTGALAGMVTGLLHVKLKIDNLMSGILVMIGLYSINLRIMGKANIPLFNEANLFKGSLDPLIVIIIFVVICKIILDLFLKTKSGFLLVAVGDNEQVVTSLGVNKDTIKVIGLMISNALVALAGALTAQYQGFADINLGTGTVVMGLASVIIGVSILGKVSFVKATTLSIVGAIIYKAVIAMALGVNLNASDVKLLTAVIVIIALTLNNRNKIFRKKKRGGAIAHVESSGSSQSI